MKISSNSQGSSLNSVVETPEHESVLLDEVLHWMRVRPGGLYVDGTVGLGGHSAAILEHSSPDGFLVGFEWDEASRLLALKRLQRFKGRFVLVRENFARMGEVLQELQKIPVTAILVDLGLSSYLLEGSGRGFSFLRDEVLDMRMDDRFEQTARDLVNTLPVPLLEELLRSYGEERFARRIAKAIGERRKSKPIETSKQLAEVVWRAVPPSVRYKRLHPATRTFQALRIAVNRELENLKRFLETAPDCLATGGRLVVISFHSLEDRLVKQAFKADKRLKVLTKKPIVPSAEEVRRNPRSRSAKLRVAEKI